MEPEPRKTKPSPWRWVFRLAVLGVIAWAAARYIDFQGLGNALGRVGPGAVALLVGLLIVDRTLMAVKWQHLLHAAGVRLPFASVWLGYMRSSFAAPLIPVSLGTDLLRLYLVKEDAQNTPALFASILVERVIALLSAVILAGAGAAILAGELNRGGGQVLLYLVPVAGVAVWIVFWISLSPRTGKRLVRWIPSRKLKGMWEKFHDAYAVYRERKPALFQNLGLAVVEHFAQVAVFYVAARAVGVEAEPLQLWAVLFLSEFVRKVAVVVEGWGLAEFLRILVCSLAGIDQNKALAFSLLVHAALLVTTLPTLFLGRGSLLSRRRPAASPTEVDG